MNLAISKALSPCTTTPRGARLYAAFAFAGLLAVAPACADDSGSTASMSDSNSGSDSMS